MIVCLVSLHGSHPWIREPAPFGPGSRPLCEHMPRAQTLLNILHNSQLLTKLSCEPYPGSGNLSILPSLLINMQAWEIQSAPTTGNLWTFPVVGHRNPWLQALSHYCLTITCNNWGPSAVIGGQHWKVVVCKRSYLSISSYTQLT